MKVKKTRKKTSRKKKSVRNVKNQQETAVALRYSPTSDGAPKVIAKGKGYTAREIIRLAKEHNIPIKEDWDLVEMLSRLELEEEIPEKLYSVVAEVLAFVYKMNKLAVKI